MSKKILVVLTNVDQIGTSGKQTGWYLPELAHPYKVLKDAGFTEMDSVSPKGGKCPMDEGSAQMFKDDPICQEFLADAKAQALVNNSKRPKEVKAEEYSCVMYPGGHGPMFDLATDQSVAELATSIYEKGGVVAAICHGPAGLLPITLSSKEQLIKGKKVTCFSDDEEVAVGLMELMPFSLESKLASKGAIYCKQTKIFEEQVVVDGRLITGKNPASSTAFGKEIIKQLQ